MCFKETPQRLKDRIDGFGSEWMIIRMSERGPLSLPKPHPQHFLRLISLGGVMTYQVCLMRQADEQDMLPTCLI